MEEKHSMDTLNDKLVRLHMTKNEKHLREKLNLF